MMRSEFLAEKKLRTMGMYVVSIPVPKSLDDDMDSKAADLEEPNT